eukprot:scaffold116033_cov36-Phaeocystis_antarctica.AAC.1
MAALQTITTADYHGRRLSLLVSTCAAPCTSCTADAIADGTACARTPQRCMHMHMHAGEQPPRPQGRSHLDLAHPDDR